MRALALLSGGLDSTVAAALWRAEHGGAIEALFVDYGQRALIPERTAARAVASALAAELTELALPDAIFAGPSGGALLDASRPLPSPDLAAEDQTRSSADAVWVPNRNGLLVHLAAAVAEGRGLDVVVVGFNAEEAATFPDNGAPFLDALNVGLAYSTRGRIRVEAPCLSLGKAELLAVGREAGAPVELSWSCYGPGPEACGVCESCLRRARAEAAGRDDDGS